MRSERGSERNPLQGKFGDNVNGERANICGGRISRIFCRAISCGHSVKPPFSQIAAYLAYPL